MYASNDGGYPGDPPPDGANPDAIPLEGVTVYGDRPKRSNWFQRKLNQVRGWLGDMDRRLEGNHRDVFDRKLENPDGGGIVFTSNSMPGGNEQRIGGKNADMQFENVDDMSFLGGGYSLVGAPGFGGRVDDFTNALDRGHQLFDKYTNHGSDPVRRDSLVPYLDHDTIRFERTPIDSLPFLKKVYEHNGQYYNGVFQK